MPRSTRYEIRATYHDGWTEVCQANSRRADALKDAKRISQTWQRIVRVWVTDTMPQMIDGKFIDVIFDVAVGTDWAALGRSHAAEAIDQIDAYADARASYEDNLRDTIAENHKGAPAVAFDIAVDAYNAAWDAHVAPTTRALVGTSDAIEAEFACCPIDGSAFCFAELVNDEVIAVSGFNTLDAAINSAISYGFDRKSLEFFGTRI